MSTDKERGSPVVGEKRVSQWEELMRKFSEAHKEECKTVSVDIPRVPRSVKQFPTGSRYEGTWDVLGMSGYGVYTFPNAKKTILKFLEVNTLFGAKMEVFEKFDNKLVRFTSSVIYEGEFDDGMFHGRGELKYPCGATLHGIWTRGKLAERFLAFADKLEYDESDWPYCMTPDRRYTVEHDTELRPAGESYLTAEQPPREIPVGCYDTGDGFFDPNTKVVYKTNELTNVVRYPSDREQKWIKENCRTNPITSVGPREDLYEEWILPMTHPARVPSGISVSHASMSYRYSSDCEPETESDRFFMH